MNLLRYVYFYVYVYVYFYFYFYFYVYVYIYIYINAAMTGIEIRDPAPLVGVEVAYG